MENGLVIIAGAGQGLGQSLMERFSHAGYTVAGLNRSNRDNRPNIKQVNLTDLSATKRIVSDLVQQFGTPKIVIHNTAQLTIKPFLDMADGEFEYIWRNMVLTAHNLAAATLPHMIDSGGSFLVSGATASLRGGNRFSAFASAKFALRGLTQSLAREFHPQNIHVAHVILDGIIDTPESRKLHSLDPARMMKTSELADAYFDLSHQPKSVWTHELDLRPASENF
ncbi:SDR family NAD(P)-dependent oxidoreductase [Lentilitoribacter sp. Alg239-R112]|uniref:SDR family NAD(P)-dependent oxidoreductase n=1 Tax=Lentilitoribacter sp. Alg239-R112 TaxID=2305987 RepID=UPI0013A6EBF1|nr:SDR family NAD(P)-dependent oxidoreductase [Lentilitoribacter sp. Alg239-R112]